MVQFWRSITVGVVLILATSQLHAEDAAALRAIVDKAIKAHGGAENLRKYTAGTWKGKGVFHGLGAPIEYEGEWAGQFPDKMRFQINFEAMGMKFLFLSVLHGDKGWRKINDAIMDMDKENLVEQKRGLYAQEVIAQLPLKNPAYTLAPLGEVTVEGRKTIGIKVTHKDQPDLNLFFDKETGLLTKSENRAKDPDQGTEFNQESYYSDYKQIEGIKIPMRAVIKRDGTLFVENEILEMKVVDKLDPNLFNKP